MSDSFKRLCYFTDLLFFKGSVGDILSRVKEPSQAVGLLGLNIPNTPENYSRIISHVAHLAREEGCIPDEIKIVPTLKNMCHLCNDNKWASTVMFGCGICERCAVLIKESSV